MMAALQLIQKDFNTSSIKTTQKLQKTTPVQLLPTVFDFVITQPVELKTYYALNTSKQYLRHDQRLEIINTQVFHWGLFVIASISFQYISYRILLATKETDGLVQV